MNEEDATGMMNALMSNLLTKDILYPSLKEISAEVRVKRVNTM